MTTDTEPQESDIEWYFAKKRFVYLNQMLLDEKTKTIKQLKVYRDELIKFLGLKSEKEIFKGLSEMEMTNKNMNLYFELSKITQIINKQ